MIRPIALGVVKVAVAAIRDARLSEEERKYVFDCLRDHWCEHCGREQPDDRRCVCVRDN
jgi:hypothetical protein